MKKTIVILLLIMLVSPLFSQVRDMQKINLRFGMSGSVIRLYPEADYYRNPAWLIYLQDFTIINNTGIDLGLDVDTDTRTVDYVGAGAADGKYSDIDLSVTLDEDADILFRSSEGMVIGIDADLYLDLDYQNMTDNNYTTDGVKIVDEQQSFSIGTTLGGMLAMPVSDIIDLGLMANCDFRLNGYGSFWTKDPGYNGGTRTLTGMSNNAQNTILNPYVAVGILYDLGKNAEFGISADFSYRNNDTVQYDAVDTDADGFDDSIVTEQEIQTNTDWGLGNAFYEAVDRMENMDLGVNLSYRSKNENNSVFIITGEFNIIDMYKITDYTHMIETDQSVSEYRTDVLGGNVTVGTESNLGKFFRIRMGGSLDAVYTKRMNNDLLADGSSVYLAENTFHVPEVALGASIDPNNNEIWGTGYSYQYLDMGVRGIAGIELIPANNVVIFSSVNGGYIWTLETKGVYNTDDSTLYTESELELNGGFTLICNMGAGIYFSENVFITITAYFIPFNLNNNATTDLLPDHTVNGSVGAYDDLSDTTDNSLSININTIITF